MMRLDERVRRVIAGVSGLTLLACQTPSTPSETADTPTDYRVFAPGVLVGSFPPDPLDLEAGTVMESAFGMALSDSAAFVLDAMGGVIHHLNLDGTPVATIGRRGDGPGEFSSPVAIDLDRDGNLWVADPQLSRLSKFHPSGDLIEDLTTPFAVVNFVPLWDGSILTPTLEPASLLATLDDAGRPTVLTLEKEVAPGGFDTGVMDRIGLGAFRLAPLAGDAMLLFRNNSVADFAAWKLTLDLDNGAIESIVALPLPTWLRRTIEESTKAFLATVTEEFTAEHVVVPFRSVRTIDGTIWVSPNAGDHVLLASVSTSPADSASVVVSNEDEAAEMIDAAVVGERLVILTTTDVRFYELDRVEASRFSPPAR